MRMNDNYNFLYVVQMIAMLSDRNSLFLFSFIFIAFFLFVGSILGYNDGNTSFGCAKRIVSSSIHVRES